MLLDIKSKIHTIRGLQVIIDKDLATLYGVSTSNLNKAVKRNISRFPEDFMFQIKKEEFLKFQFGTSSWGGTRKVPYAFTEQGVAMLSGVLKSQKSIEVNIQIMRAFIEMKNFISNNLEIFSKLNNLDKKNLEYDEKFELLFKAIRHDELKQGIFYDGQVFDAYEFVSKLIKSAKKEIMLFDNYIDESVLTLFTKRKKDVKVVIYTKHLTKSLKLDLEKFNSQYGSIIIKKFDKSHDRFLIIDDQTYHIGASLKDLGKKWFAFSKLKKIKLPNK